MISVLCFWKMFSLILLIMNWSILTNSFPLIVILHLMKHLIIYVRKFYSGFFSLHSFFMSYIYITLSCIALYQDPSSWIWNWGKTFIFNSVTTLAFVTPLTTIPLLPSSSLRPSSLSELNLERSERDCFWKKKWMLNIPLPSLIFC